MSWISVNVTINTLRKLVRISCIHYISITWYSFVLLLTIEVVDTIQGATSQQATSEVRDEKQNELLVVDWSFNLAFNKMNINNVLPRDVLSIIIAMLPPKDICVCQRVCKTWMHLLNEDFWKRLYFLHLSSFLPIEESSR